MAGNGDVLNTQEAAELLGAHVETIRRMARKGSIPAYKIGKDWRFRKDSLMLWAESGPGLRKSPCVLVIDDETSIRKLIRRRLESAGYRVRTASNGRIGLAASQDEPIDLILLDLNMPTMNGPAFIRELRNTDPTVPIIIVTGYPDSTLMMEAFRFGPLMLIPKPVEKKSLLTAVSITLEGSMTGRDVG